MGTQIVAGALRHRTNPRGGKNSKKARWSFRVNPATFILTMKHTENTKSPMKANKAGRKLARLGPVKARFVYDARFRIYGRFGAGNLPAGRRLRQGFGAPGQTRAPEAGVQLAGSETGAPGMHKAFEDEKGRDDQRSRSGGTGIPTKISDIPTKTSRVFFTGSQAKGVRGRGRERGRGLDDEANNHQIP